MPTRSRRPVDQYSGIDGVREYIEYYPFICYTSGLKYPHPASFTEVREFKRFELSNKACWMFTNPDDMREFKRKYTTIDNRTMINSPSPPRISRFERIR